MQSKKMFILLLITNMYASIQSYISQELFLYAKSKKNHSPIVYVPKYRGLFGNQIYQFCAAKILSEELGVPLQCPPIFGFPETYLYSKNIFNEKLPSEKVNKHNYSEITQNKLNTAGKNFIISDYTFLFSNYFTKYKNQMKQWLRFEKPLEYQKNPNDIVLHIRIFTKSYNKPYAKLLPLSFYDEILSKTEYDQVYICTNEPSHPYIQNFKKYNPIIKSTISLHEILYNKHTSYEEIIRMNFEEFRFIASFNKIVTALSTFSYWAAFLSEASEIFVPMPSYHFHTAEDYPKEDRYKLINLTT